MTEYQDEYQDVRYGRDRTLIDDFRDHASAHPERPAIIGHRADAPPTTLTFGELAGIVDRYAAALVELGVGPGDVVSFQLPNWWQFTALHLATARVGAITNAILPILRSREVRFICERVGSAVLVVPAEFRGFDYATMAAEVVADLPTRVFALGATGDLPAGVEPFEPFFDAPRTADLDARRPAPDAVAQIQFTSGTTGEPKGVVHTWNTVHAGMAIVPSTMGLAAGDTVLAVSPMAHTVGFYFGVTMPSACGMTVVLQDLWDPKTMATLVAEHGAVWTMVAPTFLSDLCATLPAGALPGDFRFSTAGAPIPPPLVDRVRERFGTRVYALWGMTEVGAVTTTRPGDDVRAAAGSDGTAMPWNEIRVADEEGAELPVGEPGRLLVRGASLFTTYHGRPDLYAAVVDDDGWFDTGDLARRLPDGGIRLAGRVKDLVIRGGENIPVVEVEAALLDLPAVREVAVVGVPDERLGERARAFVVPADPARPPTLPELLAHLAGIGMAPHFWPESLVVRTHLPRTTTGKIQKFRLREESR
jgi:cyclohexanecarboxylate-CoA ligase